MFIKPVPVSAQYTIAANMAPEFKRRVHAMLPVTYPDSDARAHEAVATAPSPSTLATRIYAMMVPKMIFHLFRLR